MPALLRACALIAAGLALLVWLIPAAPLTGDGQAYIAFVRNGLQHGASSWHERRLLGPLIVQALTGVSLPAGDFTRWLAQRGVAFPVDAQTGFFVLTVVSLAVTALLTWLAARALLLGGADDAEQGVGAGRATQRLGGEGEARALLAIPMLFATWVVAPNVREYALIDPLAWAFVAAVWWLTVRRQFWLAAAVAAVGVVAKEVVVLAAVAAAAATFERGRPPHALLVAAPALVVVVGLTLLLPGSGADAGGYVFKWLRDGLFSNGVPRAAFLLFASYGALWLLVPLGWQGLPAHLKRAAAVYLLAAPLMPLVGSPERMEEAIFPALVTLAVLATRKLRLPLAWALALGELLFVARVGGDARVPSAVAWAGLAVACALAAWSYLALVRRVGVHLPDQDLGSIRASG